MTKTTSPTAPYILDPVYVHSSNLQLSNFKNLKAWFSSNEN